jgi:hypothetical protein
MVPDEESSDAEDIIKLTDAVKDSSEDEPASRSASNLKTVGSDLDSEISLSSFLADKKSAEYQKEMYSEKLENVLNRMLEKEMVSEMVVRVSTRVLEETVSREMGKVEKILKDKIKQKKRNHAE